MHPLDLFIRVIAPLAGLAIALTLVMVGVNTTPNNLQVGFAPSQPLEFSHKVHAGDNGIPCQYCHTGVTDARYAGIPAVETCMNCHRVARAGTDPIRELTRIYEEGEALPWKRVHDLPDHVYFDHRPHVNANIDCAVCHGTVEEMDKVGQTMSLRMGNCLDCHRGVHDFIASPKLRAPVSQQLVGPENCNACHR